MRKEDCRTGMKVVFGRPNGEKTVGEIVEISENKVQIKTLESRGDGNRGSDEHRTKIKPAGTIWSATFDIVEPLNKLLVEALHSLPPKDERLMDYLERGSETLVGKPIRWLRGDDAGALLQTIFVLYRNRQYVASWSDLAFETTAYNRKLELLFEALGRPVSDSVSRAWADDQRIRREIDQEFADADDRMKAHRHWRKILEYMPDDYDHQERILLWNERRLSPAWADAGLPRDRDAALMGVT